MAYLGGSVSFPYWIARRAGVDLRHAGARKLGGSNLARTVSPAAGVAGGLLDAAKGPAAIVAARAAGLPEDVALACGLAAVAGQMWPVFHGFDGGRGNATGWAALLAVDLAASAVAAIPLVAAVLLRAAVRPHPTRLLPVAALLTFSVWSAALSEQDGATSRVGFGIALLVLVIARRITAGLRDDLRTGAPPLRVVANRALFDRSELQRRGEVPL
ncbi:MAG TPA: glycerol-3-phosphate acyltransferase [Candidatus Limnocylindria bacterium]|nr:glycerol-3-phosphate acyltransferase [Candidatus Limnocylindria bacterium]